MLKNRDGRVPSLFLRRRSVMKVSLNDKKLNYCGRIDDRDPESPVFS